ncbi:MAG: hypothetical protein ACRDIF_00700 [Actinomycetota bacterium]
MTLLKALLVAGVILLVAVVVVRRRQRRHASSPPRQERRAEADSSALQAGARREVRVGFDLERLGQLESATYQPVIEYLSYIQVRRGEAESLLFVRDRDLDALSSLTGLSRQEFEERFKKIGVLLSLN